ncbi:hypothetical protein EJ08DRAFT_726401, partial [Tothia fuscella]
MMRRLQTRRKRMRRTTCPSYMGPILFYHSTPSMVHVWQACKGRRTALLLLSSKHTKHQISATQPSIEIHSRSVSSTHGPKRTCLDGLITSMSKRHNGHTQDRPECLHNR